MKVKLLPWASAVCWIAPLWIASFGTAEADLLPVAPVSVILPPPASNAFEVSTVFGPNDGLMYVWDGASVLKQSAIDSNTFASIGTVGSGSADASPMAFSRDASAILVGNGAGGLQGGVHANKLFSIPAAGGNSNVPVGDVPFHFTLLASPMGVATTQYFLNQGNASFTASSVSLFDTADGSNQALVENIPGASTSMAIDGGRLFVGIGFGPQRGQLRSFALADLANAANSSTPLDWTAGALFNNLDNNSGAGMFFDARGYLFVGGPNGVTVFNPLGESRFYGNGGFTTIVYDPFGDRFFVNGFGNQQGIYPAAEFFPIPEPTSIALTLMAAGTLAIVRLRRRATPSPLAGEGRGEGAQRSLALAPH